MKKISSFIIGLFCVGSAVAQVEFDRPESFLFERKNRLLKQVDSTADSAIEKVSTKRKNFSLENEVSYKGYFSAYGSGYMNSSAITNSFFKSYFYTYSFIDNDLKQQQVDRLKPSNRIGTDIKIGIYGQYKIKNTRYEAGINYREFSATQFSADAFKLVFYGNSMFAGQTASLKPMNAYVLNYQSFYMGARKNLGKKENVTIGGRIGFVRGGRLQKIRSTNTSLYTDPEGQFLTLNGKFDVAYTDDSTYSNIPSMHGAGLSTDLFFSVKDAKNELVIEVLDLGFIRWNNIVNYSGDGSYTYSGIEMNNLFSGGAFTFDPITLSSVLENMGIKKEQKDMLYMLPSTLNIAYYRHLSPKVTLSGGVRQQFVAGYVPRLYAKAAYYIKKDFVIIPTVAYGGFGRADFELGISKSFSDHFLVSTKLFWFEYLVLPSASSGHGMSLAFSYYF